MDNSGQWDETEYSSQDAIAEQQIADLFAGLCSHNWYPHLTIHLSVRFSSPDDIFIHEIAECNGTTTQFQGSGALRIQTRRGMQNDVNASIGQHRVEETEVLAHLHAQYNEDY